VQETVPTKEDILDVVDEICDNLRAILKPSGLCKIFNCKKKAVLPPLNSKFCKEHFGQMISDGKRKRRLLRIVKTKGCRPNGRYK